MARFYFDVINGSNSHSDDTGIEIESDQVPREATRFLTGLAQEETPDGGPAHIVVQVRDATGHEVYWDELTLRARWNRDE
jgi:hypothetical protein